MHDFEAKNHLEWDRKIDLPKKVPQKPLKASQEKNTLKPWILNSICANLICDTYTLRGFSAFLAFQLDNFSILEYLEERIKHNKSEC